jgi:hypothetical protein
MARFQHYEVWSMNEGDWEFIASFVEFGPANALAMNHKDRVRLLNVMYDNGVTLNQEVIAEVGATRGEP